MRLDRAARLFVACVLGCVVAGRVGVASAASAEAQGRKHARKANHLADINRCKLAIPEYGKALRLLKDPALLYNRAQCYRRIGEPAKAIADYRRFLVQLPAAPNRAQVESQIAVLEKPADRAPAAAVSPPAEEVEPHVRDLGDRNPPVAEAPSPSPSPAPTPKLAPTPTPELAPTSDVFTRDAPEPVINTAPRVDATTVAVHSGPTWWLWVVGAVVIAGGAVGTYLVLTRGNTEIPMSALGNYKF